MSSQVVFCCCCFLFYLHVDLLRGLAGQLVLFSSLVEHQNEKLKVIAVASSTLVLNIDHGLSSWNQSRCIFNASFTCFFVGSAARSGVTQVDFYTRFIYKFCSSSSFQACTNLILCCKTASLLRFCVHVGSRWDDKGILNDPFFGRNASISLSDLLHNWEGILKWVSPLFFLSFSFVFLQRNWLKRQSYRKNAKFDLLSSCWCLSCATTEGWHKFLITSRCAGN